MDGIIIEPWTFPLVSFANTLSETLYNLPSISSTAAILTKYTL